MARGTERPRQAGRLGTARHRQRLHRPIQPPTHPTQGLPTHLHTAPPSPKSTRRVTLEVQALHR